jgi:hypothetical protein
VVMNSALFIDPSPAAGEIWWPVRSSSELGAQRIEDPHHPRGYRELRSPAEMRKLMNQKIVEQNGVCPICNEEFKEYADVGCYADVAIRY